MQSDKLCLDPLYLEDLLSEEEKSIRKSAHDFCYKYLLPKVVKCAHFRFLDPKMPKKAPETICLISFSSQGAKWTRKCTFGL